MGASSGSLALVNPTTGLLEIAASEGLPEDASAMSLRPNEGITGWVAHHGEPLRISDVSADERYISARPEVRSELAVPLFIEEDVRAVLNVDAESVDAFSETDQKLLEELARHATQVIVNTWQYEQHRHKLAPCSVRDGPTPTHVARKLLTHALTNTYVGDDEEGRSGTGDEVEAE